MSTIVFMGFSPIEINADFSSKQANDKIQKIGGKINIVSKK